MDKWTPRVTARRELAELLKKQPDRVAGANLLMEDMEVLIEEGRKAEEADAEQKEQLAEGMVDRAERKEMVASIFQREDVLRGVASAVVHDLKEERPRESMWLSFLSFARFRLRDIAKPKDKQGDQTVKQG
ncbi:MAG: hypothetical protein JXQ75_20600, partial [Phycisphaerae bacterium]|nr:hypothetical protein [Phycisphaerae bacterium]